jgi:tetratricopeptide (TPR) repeat protein
MITGHVPAVHLPAGDSLGRVVGLRRRDESLKDAEILAAAPPPRRDQAALRLPLMLAVYFDWRRRFDGWLATTAISLNVARRLGDRPGEATALTNLGLALRQMRRFEEAITACQDALGRTGPRAGISSTRS